METNEIRVETKTKGLYQILKEGGFLGDITSKTIRDFLFKNFTLDFETKERLMCWENELKFWEESREVYRYMEMGAPFRKLNEVMKKLIEVKSDQIWLDAGCGPAKISEIIWEKSDKSLKKIVGIDIIIGDLARQKLKEIPVLELKSANLGERLNFPDNYFDGIVSNLVISYIIDFEGKIGKEAMQEIFNEFARILKPGGQLVWSTVIKNIHPEIGFISATWDILTNIKKIPNLPITITNLLKYAKTLQRKGKSGAYTYLSTTEWNQMLKKSGFINSTWNFVFIGQTIVNSSFLLK